MNIQRSHVIGLALVMLLAMMQGCQSDQGLLAATPIPSDTASPSVTVAATEAIQFPTPTNSPTPQPSDTPTITPTLDAAALPAMRIAFVRPFHGDVFTVDMG